MAKLSEYLVKGFTLDDDRLKGRNQLADYFDELLDKFLRDTELPVLAHAGSVTDALREYRSALISATVTGKIDVRQEGP